jgi:hypothetical protein
MQRGTINSSIGVTPGGLAFGRDMILDIPLVTDLVQIQSPTLPSGDANAVITLKGICNGCSDTMFFNQWEIVVSSTTLNRMLQAEDDFNFETSKCFCPINTNSTTDNISTMDWSMSSKSIAGVGWSFT